MAANLAAQLAALGAPSSSGQQGGGGGAPAPRLPPKKRHREVAAASSASAAALRVDSAFRPGNEGARAELVCLFWALRGDCRATGVLRTVFQHPASSVIAITSKGQPAGYVVNARFMADVQSQQLEQRRRIEALQHENERLRLANASLGRHSPPRGAQLP